MALIKSDFFVVTGQVDKKMEQITYLIQNILRHPQVDTDGDDGADLGQRVGDRTAFRNPLADGALGQAYPPPMLSFLPHPPLSFASVSICERGCQQINGAGLTNRQAGGDWVNGQCRDAPFLGFRGEDYERM